MFDFDVITGPGPSRSPQPEKPPKPPGTERASSARPVAETASTSLPATSNGSVERTTPSG
jgi:hypothetical protein